MNDKFLINVLIIVFTTLAILAIASAYKEVNYVQHGYCEFGPGVWRKCFGPR